ncbi:MAG: 50S ribosomal protein L6 [Kiritimatiellia bacterium]
MSRIGLQPVQLPAGVKVALDGGVLDVSGPKGALQLQLPEGVLVEQVEQEIQVKRIADRFRAVHGLVRSLIANMVTGVTEGYRKDLVINGVGFRAALNGRTLSMSLGFASPVEYTVPETVTVAVNNNTEITVSGIDKQQVGNVAARIRSYYPAEPYKGKGVQYKGERIRRKEGKTVA